MAHSRRSTVLLLVGVLAAGLPLPYSAAAVAPLVWSGFESVRAIRAIRSQSATGAPTRGIVSGVIGLVLACTLATIVLLPFTVYGTAKSLQDCTAAANTAIAAADCNARFYGGLESIFGGLLSSG